MSKKADSAALDESPAENLNSACRTDAWFYDETSDRLIV